MGSLTRRMRKAAPKTGPLAGVRVLPPVPHKVIRAEPIRSAFEAGSVEVFVGRHRLEPLEHVAFEVQADAGPLIVEAGPAALSKAETFQPGPPAPPARVLPENLAPGNPQRRRTPMQTLLLLAMVGGLGINTSGGRDR
jgi:hypothetical protein